MGRKSGRSGTEVRREWDGSEDGRAGTRYDQVAGRVRSPSAGLSTCGRGEVHPGLLTTHGGSPGCTTRKLVTTHIEQTYPITWPATWPAHRQQHHPPPDPCSSSIRRRKVVSLIMHCIESTPLLGNKYNDAARLLYCHPPLRLAPAGSR